MDPERIRSYLQVACSALGFDIGEVWWTSNDSGSSTVATIEKRIEDGNERQLRFVQLYTSKNYENRRAMLVKPERDEPCEENDLKKHVLSPQLVNSIAQTAQVLWAHTQKSEGLLGRSDVHLQTAVGMPVAVDADGNMCVVVMFSPNVIRNTDEKMEYMQFISRSATSVSIPCLLPVFDKNVSTPPLLPPPHSEQHLPPILLNAESTAPGDGIVARFVNLDDGHVEGNQSENSHDLAAAPKDCFGIPMLPSFAELGSPTFDENPAASLEPVPDAFDEASFGVWSTVMDMTHNENRDLKVPLEAPPANFHQESTVGGVVNVSKAVMPPHQRERLEEFVEAFLGMSVFDAADVWIPCNEGDTDALCHVTSVVSTDTNAQLNNFKAASQGMNVHAWSGAVGRAFASGNPVWSANPGTIVDSERAAAFRNAGIQTALAVPIISPRYVTPVCVVCCYSLVRSNAVSFVLRFVQQALKLLWSGLDQIEPHDSVHANIWKKVGPADLGEMAADLEMQQEFLRKKRPHQQISRQSSFERRDSLNVQLETLNMQKNEEVVVPDTNVEVLNDGLNGTTTTLPSGPVLPHPIEASAVQNHVQDAARAMAEAVPFTTYQHISTTSNGSKRAHVVVYKPTLGKETTVPVFNSSQVQSRVVSQHTPQSQLQHQTFAFTFQQNSQLQQQSSLPSLSQAGQPVQTQQQQVESFVQPQRHTLVSAPPSSHSMPNPLSMPNAVQNQFISSSQPGFSGIPMVHTNHARTAIAPPPNPALQRSNQLQPQAQQPVSVSGMPPLDTSMNPAHSMNLYSSSAMLPSQPAMVSNQFCIPTAPSAPTPEPPQAGKTTGKVCRIQGCDEPAIARRPYCVRHSGNRLCEHPGCTKCAQGSTRFCIAHGGGRRCTFPGCDKGARDKYFCAAHGGGKRCTHAGCTKSAVGGSNLCTSHGGGRRCAVEGCDKSAQSSTKFCVKHGGGKKCAHPGCEKVARGRTLYCAAHGGGVRCKLEGCSRVAIGKLQLCRTHGGGARSRGRNSSQKAPMQTTMNQSTTTPGVTPGIGGHI